MFSLPKASLLACLFTAHHVLALPEVFKKTTTCAPTIYTTSHITTITIESIVTAPHSCFSFTAYTPQVTSCPTLKCGPIPECILEEQTTMYVPESDPCCPTTTTTTIQGPCPTCQTGCATFLEVVTVKTSLPAATANKRDTTAAPSTTSSAAVSSSTSSGPCTFTAFRAEPLTVGPTRTLYPYTVTQTTYYDCEGCEYIYVRNIAGLGPVVHFTTTTFDPTPTTSLAFECAPSLAAAYY